MLPKMNYTRLIIEYVYDNVRILVQGLKNARVKAKLEAITGYAPIDKVPPQ